MSEPFTAYLDTPNKSPRQNVARRGVVLHHAAMTSLSGLRRLAMGAKQVSATGICKDHDLERLMSDGWRPWSLSDAYWDSALRSVETANESTAGWTISDESHWSLARGVAYWARVDGFWPQRDGDPRTWTVIGHREVYTIHGGSYGTACPGGMDLNLVVARAQALLRGGAKPAPTPPPPPPPLWVLEEKENDTMFMLKINDGEKRYDPKGGAVFAVVGENFWLEIRTVEAANVLAKRFGDAANVTYAEWDAAKAAAQK